MDDEKIVCPVMIIDDDETDRYLLKRLLKKAGIQGEIFEANNGQSAIDLLAESSVMSKAFTDPTQKLVIFLDINMPIMNGFEFLDRFEELQRERMEYRTVVFAMISTSNLPADINRAKSYGFVKNFISKGEISALDLRSIFKDLIKQSPVSTSTVNT